MKEESFAGAFLLNALLMCLWHYSMFLVCISIKLSHFNPEKPLFRAREWEENGKWYNRHLKVNEWKDCLPQHVGKNGFSKRHLTDVSPEYLDKFILETCRGEWDHWMCCLYFVISIFVNRFSYGILFGLIAIAINLPFIIIQRYNRFRLLILKKRILRERAKTLTNTDAVMA